MTAASDKVFTVEFDASGVAFLTMDVPGEPVNTLNERFTDDFETALSEIDANPAVRAVVLQSGKKDSFLAGADVKMITAITSAEEAVRLVQIGQRSLQKLVDFRVPVVAAIHGPCLGGGLELAGACDARVATDHKKTRLGLPEVQLGLLPAAGGTQRWPRIIGVQAALDLMLTGKQLDARRALKMGVVDEVVPVSHLRRAATELALSLAERMADKETPLDRITDRFRSLFSKDELQELVLADNPFGRKVLFDQARKKVLDKTRGNYPAPMRIIDAVQIGLADGEEAGLAAEANGFAELVTGPEAKELLRIFTTTTAMKKDAGVEDASVEPRTIDKLGMIGAGLMGAGIAYVTASIARIPVRLKDANREGIGKGLAYCRELADGRVARKRMTARKRLELMNAISPTVSYSGFADCPVVIEAVFEDLELKRQIVRDVEKHGPTDVIFASNTSTLPITEIASASAHPETVIGMHYFSPVHMMPLLEVIRTDKTAPWVIATCVELGKRQGKTVIVVRDGVGFYTTRILAPYMNEAFHVLSEGVKVEEIDAALVQHGFQVGPVKLLDEVGIDVAHKVSGVIKEAFGSRIDVPMGMDRLVADNRLGRKNGRGFYLYGGKKKGVDETVYSALGLVPATSMDPEEIALRCTLQMVNEAAHAFGEGILRSAADGDIGAIFGLGFPPFRGGPFRYADNLGIANLVDKLRTFESRFGARFRPAPVLERLAREGGSFYGKTKRAEPGKDRPVARKAAS